MQSLWLLTLVPVWIFICAAIGQKFVNFIVNYDHRWWSTPLSLALGIPLLFLGFFGLVGLVAFALSGLNS